MLHRLSRLGVTEGPDPPEAYEGLGRLAHRAGSRTYKGTVGGTRLRLQIRESANLELRITFTPRISLRRAGKLVSRLGLTPAEGSWI